MSTTLLVNFLRRLGAVVFRSASAWRSYKVYAVSFFRPGVQLGRRCQFGRDVSIRATDGGVVRIRDDVAIGDCVTIVSQGGTVDIGVFTFVGAGSVLVAKDAVSIGRDCLLAEYVTVRDQDHSTSSVPYRLAGFEVAPVSIGDNVWIGAKATVLSGTSIGCNSVVGANSVVLSSVPASVLAAGAPATIKKKL